MSEIQGQRSGPSTIIYAQLTSAEDPLKRVDLATGAVELRYYEGILQDGVKATFVFTDTGNSIDGKTVMEGLPFVGTENFQLKIKDNNNNELTQTMIASNPTSLSDQSTKSVVAFDLSSEAISVESSKKIPDRYQGKISDHVRSILATYLESGKEFDIEETENEITYEGRNFKPFYCLNDLSMKSVPVGGLGNVAGFFFYETADKMMFKSIDSLFDKEKNPIKKSIIYNESTSGLKLSQLIGGTDDSLPVGYDYKAMTYDKVVCDALARNKMGAFCTSVKRINPFTLHYENIVLVSPSVQAQEINPDGLANPMATAGRETPKVNPSVVRGPTRNTIAFSDNGVYDEEFNAIADNYNFDSVRIYNQAIMRYNNVFAVKINITIEGDFSLHPGDAIFFDAPSPRTDTKNDEVDRQTGGLYIIASLCHYISSERTLTKLCLVRDSFGRKGNHTRRR